MTQERVIQAIRPNAAASPSDFYFLVSRGLVPGHSTIVLRGHNPSQTAASGFVDISEFGDLTYLTTAETMNIASTDDEDGGAGTDTGALTLLVNGVANDGSELEETVTMNGTTNVLTAGSYLRVNFILVMTAGSVGWNIGDITAKASSAGTTQCECDATESRSQNSHYTVPLGKTAHMIRFELNLSKTVGGTPPVVEFKFYVRPGGATRAWVQGFDKRMDAAVSNEFDVDLGFPTSTTQLKARSDMRFRADTDQNSTETRTRMYIVLVDN